jgi:hypothetical protein
MLSFATLGFAQVGEEVFTATTTPQAATDSVKAPAAIEKPAEEPQPADPVLAATPTAKSATVTIEVPTGVQKLLDDYVVAFAEENVEQFEKFFWDARHPKDYVDLFRQICQLWYDTRLNYKIVEIPKKDDPDKLSVIANLQYRYRVSLSKRPGSLNSYVQFDFERRDGKWRILTIRNLARKP